MVIGGVLLLLLYVIGTCGIFESFGTKGVGEVILGPIFMVLMLLNLPLIGILESVLPAFEINETFLFGFSITVSLVYNGFLFALFCEIVWLCRRRRRTETAVQE